MTSTASGSNTTAAVVLVYADGSIHDASCGGVHNTIEPDSESETVAVALGTVAAVYGRLTALAVTSKVQVAQACQLASNHCNTAHIQPFESLSAVELEGAVAVAARASPLYWAALGDSGATAISRAEAARAAKAIQTLIELPSL